MKHAILILAHKNISQLCRLIEYFKWNCDVFIHIDKKTVVTPEDERKLQYYKQVKLISRKYTVNWGGTSVLDSEMHLLHMAKQHSDASYFHLISGQDYPVRPLNYFLKFFKKNAGKEFIQYVHLPHPKWEGNTFRRLQYFYPYDYANNKTNPRQWVREQVKNQHKKGLKRPIPDEFDHLYGSSQWFSITRKAAESLLQYTEYSPKLYQRMRMTFAPEECYVATVIINLMGVKNIIPWNYRFIRWQYENGNRPANLGCEHFHYLLEHEYFFARKIDLPCSIKLLEKIDLYLLKDCNINQSPTGGWEYNGMLLYTYGYNKVFCDFVTQLWWEIGAKTGIDMGCGNGYYVSQWRSHGLPFAGYDANPYTTDLSRLLLPVGDEACGVADLTEELVVPESFDLVVCKDVLPYIPNKSIKKAIKNLAKLSSRFILLSWNVQPIEHISSKNNITEEEIAALFEHENFVIEPYMTAKLRMLLKRKDCCLLGKQNVKLLI